MITTITLSDPKGKSTEHVLEIPTDFSLFASKHKWLYHSGNIVTLDIGKSGLFEITTPRRNTAMYASYQELHDWYKHLNIEEKTRINDTLDQLDNVTY